MKRILETPAIKSLTQSGVHQAEKCYGAMLHALVHSYCTWEVASYLICEKHAKIPGDIGASLRWHDDHEAVINLATELLVGGAKPEYFFTLPDAEACLFVMYPDLMRLRIMGTAHVGTPANGPARADLEEAQALIKTKKAAMGL
jgi:hypothetical protein